MIYLANKKFILPLWRDIIIYHRYSSNVYEPAAVHVTVSRERRRMLLLPGKYISILLLVFIKRPINIL